MAYIPGAFERHDEVIAQLDSAQNEALRLEQLLSVVEGPERVQLSIEHAFALNKYEISSARLACIQWLAELK